VQEAGVFQRISDAARASRSELLLVVLLGLAIVGTGLVVILRSWARPHRLDRYREVHEAYVD
jgi:hypothetical protein